MNSTLLGGNNVLFNLCGQYEFEISFKNRYELFMVIIENLFVGELNLKN